VAIPKNGHLGVFQLREDPGRWMRRTFLRKQPNEVSRNSKNFLQNAEMKFPGIPGICIATERELKCAEFHGFAFKNVTQKRGILRFCNRFNVAYAVDTLQIGKCNKNGLSESYPHALQQGGLISVMKRSANISGLD